MQQRQTGCEAGKKWVWCVHARTRPARLLAAAARRSRGHRAVIVGGSVHVPCIVYVCMCVWAYAQCAQPAREARRGRAASRGAACNSRCRGAAHAPVLVHVTQTRGHRRVSDYVHGLAARASAGPQPAGCSSPGPRRVRSHQIRSPDQITADQITRPPGTGQRRRRRRPSRRAELQ